MRSRTSMDAARNGRGENIRFHGALDELGAGHLGHALVDDGHGDLRVLGQQVQALRAAVAWFAVPLEAGATASVPPCVSTISLAMAKPSPKPDWRDLVLKNGSKMRWRR